MKFRRLKFNAFQARLVLLDTSVTTKQVNIYTGCSYWKKRGRILWIIPKNHVLKQVSDAVDMKLGNYGTFK
jgi:hypothetical protein